MNLRELLEAARVLYSEESDNKYSVYLDELERVDVHIFEDGRCHKTRVALFEEVSPDEWVLDIVKDLED